ncbi:hypothetical protein D4764_17G0009380 [Takifugu flavidus]|uniref:Uncharacterized protein n=1 Tax=Takifugu flavidus TaxID=433684 RepID=A0A5C6NWW3_9TELE|nr:hypothetical protein D4764_17G0009380 [Takifugu flavidus]
MRGDLRSAFVSATEKNIQYYEKVTLNRPPATLLPPRRSFLGQAAPAEGSGQLTLSQGQLTRTLLTVPGGVGVFPSVSESRASTVDGHRRLPIIQKHLHFHPLACVLHSSEEWPPHQ